MPRPGPTLEQLKVRLTKLLPFATSFQHVAYRASTPKYATESDLLTGEGSKRYGGRWNPVGIAAVYCSLSPETAMAETLANNRYYGIPIEDAMPRVFVAIEIKLHRILDLRRGDVRRRLGISQKRLLTVDWRSDDQTGVYPITQQLGQVAYEVGWEAVIVPSAAAPTGYNLVVFPGNLLSNSRIRVHNATLL